MTLPGQLRVGQAVDQATNQTRPSGRTWQDIRLGTTRLFLDRYLRYALAMQLVASITGAQILVNTESAWSHFWWLFSYPLAGWLGSHQAGASFLYGSLIGLVLLVITQLLLSPNGLMHVHKSYWHNHEHTHDEDHKHQHRSGILAMEPHTHPHPHQAIRHSHTYSGSHNHHA